MSSQLPLPVPPEVVREPQVPVPAPPSREPIRPGPWLTVGLCIVASLFTVGLLSTLSRGGTTSASSPAAGGIRTAVASTGNLQRSLRIGGTIETLDYTAIRAPVMRGPRDSGRASLTLAKLADAGTIVEAGAVVAEFELKWLVDHIEDRQSVVVRTKSQMRKTGADVLILKETERQGRVNAKAEFDKASLDVRKADVLSEIEAEVLRNIAAEAHATWEQLEEEGRLMERVHAATMRGEELKVREEVLHVERHERDFERLSVRTTIDGMVVRESMFNRNGQFAQTKEGDQIFPGTLFMRVVDVANMVLSATVNQVDAQSIRIGDRAELELDAYPGERFAGHVVDVGAVATSAGGSSKFRRPGAGSYVKHIPVRILITDRDERILPDLSASADVFLAGQQAGLLVPREAVWADPDGADFVYVREAELYSRRDVVVGGLNDIEALIESGLRAGEEVLLGALPTKASSS